MKAEHLPDLLKQLTPLMRNFPALWCIAGGWAIDLFLGRETRPHEDVEIAIFREDQSLLHSHFREWTFHQVVHGQLLDWPASEHLKLPIHEIRAHSLNTPSVTLEFLLNEQIANDWAFRRDISIRFPLNRTILRGQDKVPFLCPTIVLLYKSKNPGLKDEQDFRNTSNALTPRDRQWLRASLQHCDPEHPWVGQLT